MTNTITINFMSELRGRVQLSDIIVVPSMYNITFATRKSITHFNKCHVLFPIVPIVKLVKYGYSWKIKHI